MRRRYPTGGPGIYLLEADGLDVRLVNAREVKNVPGPAENRQARLRCGWQADRAGHAAAQLRAAAADPAAAGLSPGCARTWSRTGPGMSSGWRNCWSDALIKLSSVASDILGLSRRGR